jgi:hypothetical protein
MKNSCIMWARVILSKQTLLGGVSRGFVAVTNEPLQLGTWTAGRRQTGRTAAQCAQSWVCRIIHTDMVSGGNSDAVSNKFRCRVQQIQPKHVCTCNTFFILIQQPQQHHTTCKPRNIRVAGLHAVTAVLLKTPACDAVSLGSIRLKDKASHTIHH